MLEPMIDPNDIADIKRLVEGYPDAHPRNADGSYHGQIALTSEQASGIVNTVLSELAARGYAIMKPENA